MMDFTETFVLLLALGLVLGLVFLFVFRFFLSFLTGASKIKPILGTLLFSALLALSVGVPSIRELLLIHVVEVSLFGLLFALVLATTMGARKRTQASLIGGTFAIVCVLLFVMTSFAFVTSDYSPLRGEELAALVEVEPTVLTEAISRSHPLNESVPNTATQTAPITVNFPSQTPAINIKVYTLTDGKIANTSSSCLPGSVWGVGGQVIEIKNWLMLFGQRAFYRLTTLDAKFEDNRLPHVGENLPGYDPWELDRRLDQIVPLVDRRLKDVCSVRQVTTDYDFITYVPASRGRHFGIFARPQGGFVPRALTEGEFNQILESSRR